MRWSLVTGEVEMPLSGSYVVGKREEITQTVVKEYLTSSGLMNMNACRADISSFTAIYSVGQIIELFILYYSHLR